MNMCESYLTRTYLKVSEASSGKYVHWDNRDASAITKSALPGFSERLWLFGKARWGWALLGVAVFAGPSICALTFAYLRF
jgi:hypothetical protein